MTSPARSGDVADVGERLAQVPKVGFGCVEEALMPTKELARIALSGCFNSCVRVAVSSPSVATRATCSSWPAPPLRGAATPPPLASRYIHRNAEKLRARAVVGLNTTTARMNPADHAVRAMHAILHFVFASRLERPGDRAVACGAILGMHAIDNGAQNRGARPARGQTASAPARSSTHRCRRRPIPTWPGCLLPRRDPSGPCSHAALLSSVVPRRSRPRAASAAWPSPGGTAAAPAHSRRASGPGTGRARASFPRSPET